MIDTLYVEEALKNHPHVLALQKRFFKAHVVFCERYTEVFNRKNQSFRLQKQKPALILAQKASSFVLPVPASYTLGKSANFYFSHILNCLYDCRYCFLQGMYRSANYVLFVNFEDFQKALLEKIEEHPLGATFFSGYDGDSLALNPLSCFLESFIPFFKDHPNHELELRTKSNAIHPLLSFAPLPNVILAYSLSPPWIVERFEHKTARAHQRLKALKQLQDKGWPIGLRFDPILYHPHWEKHYGEFFDEVFHTLDPHRIHSVTLGPFRMPYKMALSLQQQFPEEALFFHQLSQKSGQLTYTQKVEDQLMGFCQAKIKSYVPQDCFYPSLEKASL